MMDTLKNDSIALEPASIVMNPKEPRFQDTERLWQGIASVEKTSAGRLFVVFYSGGKTEESGNFAVLVKSDNGGRSWTSPYLAVEHPNPAARVFDPNIWIDPAGMLWLIWNQSYGKYDGRGGVWVSICNEPDTPTLEWSAPRRIANGIMMNKPTVLSDGAWLFPCAVWKNDIAFKNHPELENEYTSNVYASTDNGKSFVLRGGAEVKNKCVDEHMVIELKDKRLRMLVRTKYGIGQSYSSDGGYTWSPGGDSGLGGPCSRFFIRRLKSGRVLLVNHYEFSGRSNLTAMLSEDDGETWNHRLLLDERDNVAYPDGIEDENGVITVVYDRERFTEEEILMAQFNEADIIHGSSEKTNARLKVLVNKATGASSNTGRKASQ